MRILPSILLVSVSLAAMTVPAFADDQPGGPEQIAVVPYSPVKRTEIIGIVGQPTTITFPKGEGVYRVVQTGKPDKDGKMADAGWQTTATAADLEAAPLGNNITLWPTEPGNGTMTIITMVTDGGAQKVYPFRLVALPNTAAAMNDPRVTLNLIFGGAPSSAAHAAATVTPAMREAWVQRQKAKQMEAADRIRVDAFNGADGTCHYEAHGKRPNSITPLCPMDNGQWTLMRFPGLSKKPAVYIVGPGDAEAVAPQHADGDFVVIETIAQHFRLRLGQEVLDIINNQYDPVGHDPGTGTISPGVERVILHQTATQ